MTCPKCGSSNIMSGVKIVDRYHLAGLEQNLSLKVEEEPNALVFKGSLEKPLRAQVCGGCGFTEFYVSDPAELWATYVKGQTPES